MNYKWEVAVRTSGPGSSHSERGLVFMGDALNLDTSSGAFKHLNPPETLT